MKPTKLQLDAAVAAYNKRKKEDFHAEAIRYMLQPHSKTVLTHRQRNAAVDAYGKKRNHRAGILAALRTL